MKNFKNLLLVSVIVLVFITNKTFAQLQLIEKYDAKPGTYDIPYVKWQLANGLKIIVHEDHSDPVVQVMVAYHVGSGREKAGRSGFAHFYEHMMFQGSEHVGDEEHFKIISEAGGSNNGFTTDDRTVYLQTVPSNQLEVALWLEADRMGFLLDAVTQKKFEVQRATVKNEKYENQMGRPYGMVSEILGQTMYPPGHPYSWETIGYVDDLDRATVDDLKEFFMSWYGPNNAILTVAGDVNPQEVARLAEKYFGSINKGPKVPKQVIEPPILPVDRYGNYRDNVYLPLTNMVFPTSPRYHRDEKALDILADIMGSGKSSIFYKRFVRSEKAVYAFISHNARELSGEFSIDVLAFPEFDFAHIDSLIRATIDEFEKKGITDEVVQRTKTVTVSNIIDGISTVTGKAMMLTDWAMFTGRTYNLSDMINEYNKVTKEDVQRVYNKYIKKRNAAIVNVYTLDPNKEDTVKVESKNPYAHLKPINEPTIAEDGSPWVYKKPVDNFDRIKKPTPTIAKKPVVPDFYTHKFDNGLQIIGTKTSEIPKVRIEIEIEGGDLVLTDPKLMGLSDITASLMDEGTKNYSAEQMSIEIDRLGSSINIWGSKESTNIFIDCYKDKIDSTLKLLEEKLFRPSFTEADFLRAQKREIKNLKNSRRIEEVLAYLALANVTFGNNSNFGLYSTEKTLKRIKLENVKQYYENFYSPSVAKVIIVGDITEAEILPKLEFLKQWKAKEVQLPQKATYVPVEKTKIYLVHKPYTKKTEIVGANSSVTYDYNGEHYKSTIMNFPLGGQFNSHLNLNLREDKGFTYGIRSYFTADQYKGGFLFSTSVRRDTTDLAVIEIMKELKNYVNNGMTDQELSFTKNSILNGEALDYEAPYQKSSFLSRILQYNLPKDFVAQQSQVLQKVTKDELNELAKKNIRPDNMVIVVVGNKYSIKKPLSKLGYEIVEMEIE